MKKILLPLLALACFVIACNKTPDANPDRAAILRNGKWKISAATVMMRLPNGKDSTINYYNLIPGCHLDDYLKFDSLNRGAVHNGGTSCSLADADSIAFVWQLKNDDNMMDIYNGFTLIDSVAETVLPYHIDTINANSSPIVLDTLSNIFPIVLDSMFTLQFGVQNTPAVNIYNATLTNFSQSAFTMNFMFVAHYPQMSYFSATPVITPDTFHYSVPYTNY